MNKRIKLLLFTVLVLTLCIAAVGLSACKGTTDKSKLTVTYDDTHAVYVGDTLDSLKPYLTVKYTDKDGKVTTVTDFTLSGTLSKGEATVTVKYLDLTATCKVTVIDKGQQSKPEVKVEVNGGILNGEFTVNDDGTLTPPAEPTREGYTFLGWYKDEQCTLPWNFETDKVTVEITVYVKWHEVDTSKPTVNVNVGSGATSNGSFVVNEDDTLTPPQNPVRGGYAFVGWYKDSGCVNVWNFATDKVTENITLYAKWQPKQYTITLDYNGATSGNAQQTLTVTYDQPIGNLPTPEKTGYTFAGWKHGEAAVTSDTVWKTADNATFVAQWTKQGDNPNPPQEYTVTFKADGQTVATQKYTSDNKNIIVPAVPNKKGYTGQWEEYTLTTGNVTVNAVYTAKQYTVTLNYDGATDGNTQQTITVTYDQAIGTLPAPTKTGYTFIGWKHGENTVTSTAVWRTDNNATFTVQWNKILTPTEGLAYALNSDGESYKVTGIGTATDTDIVIPSAYNDKPVTGIGDSAFYNCSSLTSVTIPNSVTSIGEYAFLSCSNLANVNMTSIESWCKIGGLDNIMDYGTSNKTLSVNGELVTELVIPNTVTSIPNYAFAYTNITNATFEENSQCTSIGSSAFKSCSSLTSVTISDSVTSIGNDAFFNCSSLTSLTIPFVGVSKDGMSNTHFGYLFGASSYSYNSSHVPSSLKTVVITGGNKIDARAFYGCSNITSIIIVSSVKIINWYAFQNCSSLTSITIPNSVTMIYPAFSGCSSLQYNEYDNAYYLGNDTNKYLWMIRAKDKNITSCIINENTKFIYKDAFYGCSKLANINYLGTIESWCNIQGLGNLMRYGTSGKTFSLNGIPVTEIVIPDTVTAIPQSAFCGCSNITSITISNNVTSIGSYAFDGCSLLASINYLGTIESWCNIEGLDNFMRYGISSKKLLFNGEELTEDLKIPSTVTSIPSYAFYGCTKITGVTFEEHSQCTSIGFSAFSGCSSLQYNEYDNAYYLGSDTNKYVALIKVNDTSITSCTINENTKVIVYSAFSGCSSLESITMPFVGASNDGTENTHLGYIFGAGSYTDNSSYVPSSLKTVIITGGTSITKNAFYECSNITSVTVPDSVTNISSMAFYHCSALESITIPFVGASKDGTENTHFGYIFGASSYDSNYSYVPSSLKTVIITGGNTIDGNAFYSCSNITNVTIPDSVISIYYSAFYGCSKLQYNEYGNEYYLGNDTNKYIVLIKAKDSSITSCNVNENTKVISQWAFSRCSSLTSITIPNSVTSIGEYTFYGCSSLTSITIPNSVTSIGSSAFYGCSSLTSITIPNSVTSIGSYAFYGCSKLTSITIPDSVTSIGSSAFSDCSKLQYNEYDNAYYLGNDTNKYIVLIKAKDSSITSCTVNENAKVIYQEAFFRCYSLKSITIPNSVTSIGSGAFLDCSRLASVNYLGTIESWCNIQGLDNLMKHSSNSIMFSLNGVSVTELVIPYTVTSISYGAFAHTNIASITIPFVGASKNGTSNTHFGYLFGADKGYDYRNGMDYGNAYYVPSSLKTVVITGGNKIDARAFYGCSNITSIIIPNSVTSIGDDAFKYCSSLKTVYYNGTAEDWSKINIYGNNSRLTSATRYYYSESEPALNSDGTAYDGNWWHYVDGVATVWKKEA